MPIPFRTAKPLRARREQAIAQRKEEIEQIAETLIDGMLGELERSSDQGWHQARRQWAMSALVGFLRVLGVFAVNLTLHIGWEWKKRNPEVTHGIRYSLCDRRRSYQPR